jgi:hypothetical protein
MLMSGTMEITNSRQPKTHLPGIRSLILNYTQFILSPNTYSDQPADAKGDGGCQQAKNHDA